MALYRISAGCGHTIEMQLYGPTSERTRRIDWMESPTGQCNPCYASRKRAEAAIVLTAEVERIAAEIRSHADQINAAVAAKLRSQMAAGQGSDAKRAAMEMVLTEMGL